MYYHVQECTILPKERAEMTVINGIKGYFLNHPNEDVFIFFNQDIEDKIKHRWLERDAIVINCTLAYILVIEAKSKLQREKGLHQLRDTVNSMMHTFSPGLKRDWDVFCILYGTSR